MKKENKKKFIIFLIGFLIGVFGFASSFFMYINNPKPIEINYDTPDVINDSAGLVFTSIDQSIYLDKVIPTLDKFGIEEKGFSFTIKNNNLDSVNYELMLVDDNSTIRNSDIRYQLIKDNEVIGIYTLSDDGIIDRATIESKKEINYTIKLWLDINSAVKIGSFNKKIGIKESNKNEFIKPILTDGLIPVYYDNETNSWHKASLVNSNWYSYEDGLWANAITVNSDKRNYYLESDYGTKIDNDDINSMWVWIPRFNYVNDKLTIVNKDESAYKAFTFNGIELAGFWFSKFESGMKSDSECITSSLTNLCNNSNNKLYFVPNYPYATKMTLATMFSAIRKMELKGNIYGFNGTGTNINADGTIKNDKNNIDTHLSKNSEWQAVLLLSRSIYGNKDKVMNNNTNYTGKVSINSEEFNYNVIDKGTVASTNGNITGVYDMAGGKREYVMVNNHEQNIFNKKSNSGFGSEIKSCYYDNELMEEDTTLYFNNKYSSQDKYDVYPITRGGYKNSGNIYSVNSVNDYLNKISVETNARACLVIMEVNNG